MSIICNFTVAIPTYNGASRLPELLERLHTQVATEDFSWEIIVVDNNSTDNTAQVVQMYQEKWQRPYPLKYCFEPKQGAAYARKRAIEIAASNLVGFLDDDNYPIASWVAAAYNFSRKYPHAGAYGSQIHPHWEVEPPANFGRISPFLAITERGNLPLLYDPRKNLLPPSAGLVVRRQAWLESVPDNPILTGRTAKSMLTSEDLEMLSYIQKAGWEIWYNPEMEIYHKIPQSRLQKDYLIPFIRGIGLSRSVTRMIKIKPLYRPLAFLVYLINDTRKIIVHLIKYHNYFHKDLVIDCEMQLFISSLISPFYIWKEKYLNTKKQNTSLYE